MGVVEIDGEPLAVIEYRTAHTVHHAGAQPRINVIAQGRHRTHDHDTYRERDDDGDQCPLAARDARVVDEEFIAERQPAIQRHLHDGERRQHEQRGGVASE